MATKIDYSSKTNAELHELVKDKGIFARQKSTKAELIDKLTTKATKSTTKASVAPKSRQYGGEY